MERITLLEELASRLVAIELAHPLRVAIDGVDAAGKTTLADELADVVEQLGRSVIRASIDGFHNPAAIRRQRGPLSPEGYFEDSFNYDALLKALLLPLGPMGSLSFSRAVFDFRTDQPVAAPVEHAVSNAILLFDGVFLLRPGVREHFDVSVFVRADFGVTLGRAERRDVGLLGSAQEVRQRYQERYIPGQQLYLATIEPERWATIVIDNNDPLRPRFTRAG